MPHKHVRALARTASLGPGSHQRRRGRPG